ncbi:non-ribosomal peptide synthetase, partial [Maribacter sp. 2307UL18-2]|uniref:non-ribosomal peptide synthetase n=1 Tax=Maribacter sp. 2307UL18-2 TaxID=3386274 RepID=UPI0039BD5474
AMESGDRLHFNLEYSTELFRPDSIDRFIGYFHRIVEEVISDREKRLSEIDILSKSERIELLDKFNDTKVDYPKDKTFISLFEEQVCKTPDAISSYDHDEELSYVGLNDRANQLSNALLSKGLSEEMPVVFLCNRSVNMLAGLIGVLKSGGAYVPLSPDFPLARITEVFHDTRSQFLVTTSTSISTDFLRSLCSVLPCLHIIYLDSIENKKEMTSFLEKSWALEKDSNQGAVSLMDRQDWEELPVTNPLLNLKPSNLAYILYTSGSSGRPKGVMIEHGGMLNHLLAKRDALDLNATSVVSQNASETFDISIWQFLSGLVVGGKTVIYSKDQVLEPESLLDQIGKDGITIFEVVPSYLSVLIGYLEDREVKDIFPDLTYLLVTGETLQKSLVKRWFDLYPDIKMVNAYGPTEASDDITHCILEEIPTGATIPIGKVLPNLNIYIVDEHMGLCPRGVKGEIVVSGIGVGRGYLNQPEKTSLVFIKDPFITASEVRMYRTGDVGRWLPDGNIEFFGRKDGQVKVNGHRIELGEIENCLSKNSKIKEVLVLSRETDGEKYLIGYYVSDEELSTVELRNHILDNLPNYMLPAYFVHMEVFPLTLNGKVDRKNLPDPELTLGGDYEAPSNEIEEKLIGIWSDLLKLDKEVIGVNTNFFDLGGDS